jgi:hypothetical protein
MWSAHGWMLRAIVDVLRLSGGVTSSNGYVGQAAEFGGTLRTARSACAERPEARTTRVAVVEVSQVAFTFEAPPASVAATPGKPRR